MYMGDTFYRGHDKNYPPRSDQDMYMSDDVDMAQTYADGKGFGGTVTPLRHNADNLLHVDAGGMGYEDVILEPEMVPDLNYDHWMDLDNVDNGTDAIAYAVKGEGFRDGTQFENIIDDFNYSDEAVPGTVQNILGSKPDIKIRHPNAAFDPQYNGPNIMGGAAGTAGLTGLLAAGQSDDSDASVASLAKRGLRIVEGHSPAATPADSLFNIVDGQDKKIGGAEFWATPEGKQYAYAMRLNKEHRGTGIMNEAYDAIEEISGIPIEPSDVLTEDGMKFWIRRDPRKMQKLYERERFDYYEKDVLDSIFAEALEAKR
jgi:hypothetical protein